MLPKPGMQGCGIAHSVSLHATNLTLRVDRVALTGVRWARFWLGATVLADVLARARLDATDLDVELPDARYGIRCARLRASVPGGELIAEGTDLRPLTGDDAFFAEHAVRKPRFRVRLPECRVSGLAYGELLQGRSYRARTVHISRPSFDTLVNCDKPRGPFVKSPLMVHEALAAIRQPLQVDSLSITDGRLTYGERLSAGAAPGVLTIGAVSLMVEGIANRGEATADIQLRGQGDLMNAGTIKLRMSIPITSSNLTLRYSGSLTLFSGRKRRRQPG